MRRLWHRIKAWFGLHPRFIRRVRIGAGVVFALTAVVAVVSVFYFHAQDNAKIQAQKVARQADDRARVEAAKVTGLALRKGICPLVYAYVHPVAGTAPSSRADQVITGWHLIGSLIGCPDGTKP